MQVRKENSSQLDIGVVMRNIEQEEQQRCSSGMPRKYGLIPRIAQCHLAGRMSSSFVERVNSAGKLLLGDRRGALSDRELGMLCVLRVNRAFMEYMYQHCAHLLGK